MISVQLFECNSTSTIVFVEMIKLNALKELKENFEERKSIVIQQSQSK